MIRFASQAKNEAGRWKFYWLALTHACRYDKKPYFVLMRLSSNLPVFPQPLSPRFHRTPLSGRFSMRGNPPLEKSQFMRMKENLECYIDGFNTVHIYMEKNFYQGKSQTFHLKDEKGNIVPLTILKKDELETHFLYECAVDAPLVIGSDYVLYDEHCRTAPAICSHIVKTAEFAEQFADPDGKNGCFYSEKETAFALWSPLAVWATVVLLTEDGKEEIFPMIRYERGNWAVRVEGDQLGRFYFYRLKVNGTIRETYDPWNIFTGINTSISQVNDLSLLPLPDKVPMEPMKSTTDAIIYEASIRDMTAQKEIGIEHPRTFQGFVEENEHTRSKRIGLSYLKELGITHVQLMPVLDFGSVDEQYPTFYYNWGYDPASYFTLEGSYSSDPYDPTKRIIEFAQMVHTLHEAGLKVVLDLVFNHVWNKDAYGPEQIMPDYSFLMDSFGNYSNGSYCGNDIDSRPVMNRQYLIAAAMQLIDVFDVDGFRFDLMGVLDIDLMNEIARLAKERKPDFMIYGEGWDMPSFVPPEIRASQNNQAKMPQVGHFSDRFREVIRGNSGDLSQPGYPAGNLALLDQAKTVMRAAVDENRYDAPFKSVNYVECHDNHTMWDKNRKACAGQSRGDRMKRQVMTNAMVLFAQGIPFIHCGQEYGRTKENLGNTYNRSDHYNMIDYNRRDRMDPMVTAFESLAAIRKAHPSFGHDTNEKIRTNTSTEDIDGKVLVYRTWDENEEMVVFFNPTYETFHYDLGKEGRLLFDLGHANASEVQNVEIGPLATVAIEHRKAQPAAIAEPAQTPAVFE